jgi:predicted XRE-type DNA-binding protein
VRDELIAKIKAQIAAGGWTQKAADLSGLTQPRISDPLRGNTSRFSLDALVSISAALERHSSTTEGGTMEYTEADGQRLVAEFMAKLAARPVKGRYPAATESSTTERGGKLIATSGFCTIGGRVAMVGDIVRYADGSEAASSPVPVLPRSTTAARWPWWAASWTTATASTGRFTTAW